MATSKGQPPPLSTYLSREHSLLEEVSFVFVCSEAIESKFAKLETIRTVILLPMVSVL